MIIYSFMLPNATLIWYYYICHREVWFMSRYLEPYQYNPFIEIGRILSENSYLRDKKEVKIENIVIDLLRKEDKDIIVGEVKKSSKFEKAAKMQLAYYLFRLKELGIEAKGELLFPKEKKKIILELNHQIEEEINSAIKKINEIVLMEKPPPLEKNNFCKKCGYKEFCWL